MNETWAVSSATCAVKQTFSRWQGFFFKKESLKSYHTLVLAIEIFKMPKNCCQPPGQCGAATYYCTRSLPTQRTAHGTSSPCLESKGTEPTTPITPTSPEATLSLLKRQHSLQEEQQVWLAFQIAPHSHPTGKEPCWGRYPDTRWTLPHALLARPL